MVTPIVINKVSELNKKFGIDQITHPLINIIDLEGRDCIVHNIHEPLVLNLYSIWFKKGVSGDLKYGESIVDFDKGTLFFMSPGQLLFTHKHHHTCGWGLFFHPDLLNGYPSAQKIRSYDFFSYSANQALDISEEEESISHLLSSIKLELLSAGDKFSQEIILTHLDALLVYADRYYHRQYLASKKPRISILENVEYIMNDYLQDDHLLENGLPTVQQLAQKLNITSGYLNEQLKANTGKGASEHITALLIEKAKQLMTTTTQSASEIAYLLGYQHSQSFSKIFNKHVGCSPIEYRRRFQNHLGYKQP
jgi:AraC family transcriptional activator of pobA